MSILAAEACTFPDLTKGFYPAEANFKSHQGNFSLPTSLKFSPESVNLPKYSESPVQDFELLHANEGW